MLLFQYSRNMFDSGYIIFVCDSSAIKLRSIHGPTLVSRPLKMFTTLLLFSAAMCLLMKRVFDRPLISLLLLHMCLSASFV